MAKGKKNNVAMILIPVVLAATGLYFIFRKKKTVPTNPISGGSGTINNNGVIIPEKIVVNGVETSVNFPLRRGSTSELVRQLQVALMQYFPALPKGYDDGKFGKNTEADLFKVTKKKMVETQAELDALIRGGAAAAKTRKDKIVGVYSPTPIRVDPFNATKNI